AVRRARPPAAPAAGLSPQRRTAPSAGEAMKQAVAALVVTALCLPAAFGAKVWAPDLEAEAFRDLDRNGDGSLTPDELEAEIFASAHASVTCTFHHCPEGFRIKSGAAELVGHTDLACCDATCAGQASLCDRPGLRLRPDAKTWLASEGQCCEATCGNFHCPSGWKARSAPEEIVQPSEEVCCFKTCELHVCGFQLTLRGDASLTPGDSDEDCCVQTCQSYSCRSSGSRELGTRFLWTGGFIAVNGLPAFRVQAAEEIGRWLRRGLKGEHRGLSGREKIPQGNQYYLVVRDLTALMAAAEAVREESEAEVPELSSLRDNFVISGDTLIEDFNIGILSFEDPPISTSVISVSLVDNRVLVALPEPAWSRLKRERALPPGALRKAVRVDLQSCSEEDRLQPVGELDLRVWLGLLAEEYEDLAIFQSEEEPVISFPLNAEGRPVLPYARSLVAVARDHFTFLSAESGLGQPEGGGTVSESRLANLEKSVQDIMNKLGKLVDQQGPTPSLKTKEKEKTRPQTQRPVAPPPEEAFAPPPGLDPQAVHQALQAGVTPNAIAEMGRFLALQPAPAQKPRLLVEPVDSSEEEEQVAGGGGGATGSVDPIGTAVIQLTKLVKNMQEQKKEKKSKSLDALLDSYESGSGKEPGSSLKSKAAALRQLQRLLVTNPTVIYQSLERRLQEDWDASEALPGVSATQISARGWLEHRSRVQNYQTSVRFGWTLAGIWDCLRLGRYEEARARAGLGVAMIDQHACDKGSFLVASELTLEEPPPFASFSRHSPPEIWETQHTRLIDGRWVDLILNKLRDLADYHDKRNKLQPPRKDPAAPSPAPKAKPSPKKKGEGKGGKGREEDKPPAGQAES
ncbi:unnamed protein product, partial [Durusdinium trenchii]